MIQGNPNQSDQSTVDEGLELQGQTNSEEVIFEVEYQPDRYELLDSDEYRPTIFQLRDIIDDAKKNGQALDLKSIVNALIPETQVVCMALQLLEDAARWRRHDFDSVMERFYPVVSSPLLGEDDDIRLAATRVLDTYTSNDHNISSVSQVPTTAVIVPNTSEYEAPLVLESPTYQQQSMSKMAPPQTYTSTPINTGSSGVYATRNQGEPSAFLPAKAYRVNCRTHTYIWFRTRRIFEDERNQNRYMLEH
jgi:hypothetical protein